MACGVSEGLLERKSCSNRSKAVGAGVLQGRMSVGLCRFGSRIWALGFGV